MFCLSLSVRALIVYCSHSQSRDPKKKTHYKYGQVRTTGEKIITNVIHHEMRTKNRRLVNIEVLFRRNVSTVSPEAKEEIPSSYQN